MPNIKQHFNKPLIHTLILAVMLLGLFANPRPVSANHLSVDTFTDEFGGNTGACSLREAIYAANNDTAFGGCTAGLGEDTILLAPGTYELSMGMLDEEADAADETGAVGDLDISSPIRIVGAGEDQTTIRPMDGAKTRIIHIASVGANVAIQQLTLTNGYAYREFPNPLEPFNEALGGAIYNEFGRLSLWRVVVTDNKARHSGGGVYSDREDSNSLFILDSTISDNVAELGDGGGVLTESKMSMWRSLVWNNTAQGGNGGGIFNNEEVKLTAVTVAGNRVLSTTGRGSGIYADGATEVFNSTIVRNVSAARNRYGFEIFAGQGVLFNNIIAYNVSNVSGTDAPANCWFNPDVYGTYNYREMKELDSGGKEICTGTPGNRTLMKLFFVEETGIGLSPTLAYNDGLTQSYALLPTSNIIDKGQSQNWFRHPVTGANYYCTGSDQRWAAQPIDGDNNGSKVCDPGAVEYAPNGFSRRRILLPLLQK